MVHFALANWVCWNEFSSKLVLRPSRNKTIDRDFKEIQKKQYDVINLLNTKAAII